jgi:hypothetical protein
MCWAPITPLFIFNQNLGSLEILLGFFIFFLLDWIGIDFLCFEVGFRLYSFLLFGLNFIKFKCHSYFLSTEFLC